MITAEYERDLVSIIIPVYNGEDFLPNALASVFEQDYRPIEVIVMDDGSTDSTARIARKWPGVRYFHQVNQGHGAAKNAGIEQSRGEFLAFLDADDWWAPGKLSLQAHYLRTNPQVGYVVSYMKMILESGTPIPAGLKPELLHQPAPSFLPSALMVRRTTLSTVGLFDPSYKVGNDSDWFFRAQDLGIQRMVLRDVLLYRRLHAKNDSNQALALWNDMFRLIRASIHRKQQTEKT